MKIIKKYLILAVIFLSWDMPYAQTIKSNEKDSLLQKLSEGNLSESKRWQALTRLSALERDPSVSLNYNRQAYEAALAHQRPDRAARSLEDMAEDNRLLGNYSKSIEYSLEALKVYDREDAFSLKTAVYTQLGTYYGLDENFPEAIESFQQAMKLQSIYQPENVYQRSLTMINLGDTYRINGEFHKAIYWLHESLKLEDSIKSNSERTIVNSYATGNLGMAYNSLDSLQLATDHLTRSIALTQQLGDLYATSVYLADLGLVEQKEGNSAQAEKNFLEAHEMAIQEGLKEQVRDFSEMLVNFYTSQQAYEEALTYQQVYQLYQDSLVNRDNIRQVEQLKANYEIEKRESEIDLLGQINDQQRLLALGLGLGLIVLLGFSWVIYRTNGKLKLSNAEVSKREQEKALLLHELNHRAKNNLQMISSIFTLQEGELKDHPAKAAISAGKYRVKALSLIHRKLYQQDIHTTINIEEYLQELVQNLCHSFGVRWQPQLELEALHIHIDKAVPLALIVNELVTNALKYAFEGIPSPGLHVRMNGSPNQFTVEVQDNGTGISHDETPATGFGSRLVQSLTGQLDANLELLDGPGTHWRLSIKG